MCRGGTNHYAQSFQLVAANPAGANAVVFMGRALDGENYTEWDRRLSGVANALPNQWLRLRRVGDYFAVYVGTQWHHLDPRRATLLARILQDPAGRPDRSEQHIWFHGHGQVRQLRRYGGQ